MAGTTQDVLAHHLACFGKGDLDGIMADYTAASRLFTPNGVLRGAGAIRELFVTLLSEFAKPGMSFEIAAGHRWRHGLHRLASRDGRQPL
jgi:hypothetical protein